MKLKLSYRTHKGLVRESNQDSVLIGETYMGVADGMGGYQGGEIASSLAVEVVTKALKGKTANENAIRLAVMAANRRVFETSKQEERLKNMGTTFSMLWVGKKGKIYVAHVGDSRVYRLREGNISPVTDDHSVVGELLRNRVISEEMAKNHRYRNMITRAVGIAPSVEVDVLTFDGEVGDSWLICSDGLYNTVTDTQIKELFYQNSLEEATQKMLDMALAAGAPDNVSLVLCTLAEDDVC